MKIGVVLIIATAMMLYLVGVAKLPNSYNNGFTRKSIGNLISSQKIYEVSPDYIKICGVTDHSLFLSSSLPNSLLILDKDLKNSSVVPISLNAGLDSLVPFKIFVDSPRVYIHVNNLAAMFLGNLGDTNFHRKNMSLNTFTRSVQISPNLVLMRGFFSNSFDQEFALINTNTNKILKKETLLKDHDDAGFVSDGSLQFDSETNKVVYVQFYQNNIFVLDTNLEVLTQSHTIDTIEHNFIEIKKIKSGDQIKILPSAPRQLVNGEFAVANGKIFVLSQVKSDDMDIHRFRSTTVVDVYKLSTCKYMGSFFFEKKHNEKVLSISAVGNHIFLLYKGSVYSYSLKA